ncbi:MAG: hypothetical protein CBB97_10330 [Candidatus Endolissoclinum sp. TMED37]|nr:MAG: hypothetical protein CBB97_10330 [Candidatus Endolissoclinum sp. TMED37]
MLLSEFKIDKPKTSDTMGITRDKMPQVKQDDYQEYKTYLKDNGVSLRPEVVDAKDLKPMQSEFSDQGVAKQLNRNKEKGEGMNPKPLLASSDSFIIDGHHRWLAAVNSGFKVNILRANVDAQELLSLTLKFPRVYFKDIYTEDDKQMDIITKAEQFAQEAHKDHKRKYTGDPYYVHLDEVRNIVKKAGGTVEQQAAALLHDTVEDTSVTPADITQEFGPKIAKLVVELTDVSKPEDGNRKVRKGIDRDKLAGVSAEAQTVKYADLISNGKDIAQNDPKFAKVYHAEKADLLRVMTKGNQNLRKQAISLLPDELKSVVNEETPFGVIARKAGHLINKKAYINMAQMMHKILTRKYKETGGKLRHGLGYYAMMLAMQTNNKINWRELEQEYLGLYGNELFENSVKESLNEEALNVKSIITPAIKKLDKIFKANDYEVRIVGGAVRDIALGKEPKDIDFATDATPDEMMAMLDKAKIKTIPTGIEHGTITAVIDNEPFEITTLRADTKTDGRRAEVEFVRSWEEDAKRRDLTYNAMSMDIDGTIHDYNGGMDDLQDKVSKFVGDPAERIKEDYLRILRYFRFQSKLDNPKWDDDTLNAIKDNVNGIPGLSVERIWQEMGKLLMGPSAKESLEWMNKTGVNNAIGLDGINPAKLGDSAGPIVSLARILDNSNIARTWKMSRYDTDMLDFLIKHKDTSINPKQAKDMLIKGVSQDHLLAWANMHGKNDVYDTVHSFEKPEFPLNGKDLLAMGYRAGPKLGELLTDLQDQWMKSNYKLSKEELLKKVPVQESIVLEKVSRFMTGHGITYKGKKHDEMEVEVVAVDNQKRQYQVMIMRPEEHFGTNVMMSARFMHRGPWVKTKIPDYMGAIAKSAEMNEWIYPALQGAAHLARTYGPRIASKLMTDPAYKIAGGATSGGGAAVGAYNYAKDKFSNKTKKQTKPATGPTIPQAESLDEDFDKLFEDDSSPEVYVDMDGVLVDFFTEWAKLMNVKTYRDISKKDIPKALKKIVDTPNFWEDLPALSGYKELLGAIKKVKGKYKILSSPLANDPNVDPGKREWVRKNLGFFRPEQVIIDHNKSKYAKQSDGSPNLLIDDFGKNVRAWQSAGGIAIKHHTSTTNDTVNAINKVFSNTVNETGGVGRVVPGINTTVDVGPNEIVKQAKKFGNDVNKDGFPKKLLRPKKK